MGKAQPWTAAGRRSTLGVVLPDCRGAQMTMPSTGSNKDGVSSPSRRLVLAGCASLVATATFAPWIRWSAPVDRPQGDIFAFTDPAKRDLVFALALSPRPFGQTERDPLTVRLHAGGSSWMVGPFALQGNQNVLSDGGCLFSGQVWRIASNGVRAMAHLIAVATPVKHMPPGNLGVWAEIVGTGGVRCPLSPVQRSRQRLRLATQPCQQIF